MVIYTLAQASLAQAHSPQIERIVSDSIYVIETDEDYEDLPEALIRIVELKTHL